MSDRGDYRSIYCSFWDDADVHALSHIEYRVLTTLKGTLPASGMGIVYVSQLAERCSATTDEVGLALCNLAVPLPGKRYGWIVQERNVAWIVNALRFEPTLTPTNGKHRTYLRDRLLAPLGKERPIVRQFQEHYAEWFPELPSIDRESDGSREATDRVSKHSPSLSNPIQPKPEEEGTVDQSVDQPSAVGKLDAFVAKHDWGRWAPIVEGYLRASRRPINVIAELELWIAGESNRKKTSPEVLGEALNQYAAAGEAEFKSIYFAGFVRGMHRQTDKNIGAKAHAQEDASLAQERREREEREADERDQALLADFERVNEAKFDALKVRAEAAVDARYTGEIRMIMVRTELIRLVRKAAA